MAETPAPPPPDKAPRSPEPRGPSTFGVDVGGGVDRIARLQTIAAVVLGLALIAIPLYLWRRPRSESIPVVSVADGSAPLVDAGAASLAAAPPAPAVTIALSDPKVMECHDPGSRRTRPEECDHLVAIEKGFAAAIVAAGPCVPPQAGGGTLVYLLDASFGRKHRPFELLIPRDGRALRNPHATAAAVNACSAAVKRGIDGLTLDGAPHAHSRYKVAITATYPAVNGTP